jgi:four helix bundle protein
MKSVEDVDIFELAHQLALKTYSVTKAFPKEETFSLVDQMRRAAASVGMNLMEGATRHGSKEYRQFVGIARGSAGECLDQLLLAKDLRSISKRPTGSLSPVHDHVFSPSPVSPLCRSSIIYRSRITRFFCLLHALRSLLLALCLTTR